MSLLALAQSSSGQGGILQFLMLPMILFLIWWFLVIKPQRMQEAKHRDMLGSLKPGARVVTTGGLYGTVSQVGENSFKLKISDNVKVEVARSAIAGLQPTGDDDGKKKGS